MPLHRYYDTYSQFARKRVSTSRANTSYTIGPEGKETFEGTPEVRWEEIVHIKNTRQVWTHGYFEGGGGTGGGVPELFPDTTTAITIGGLPSGTDITGKSAVQVLDAILSPEFAPQFFPPTVVWSKQSQYVGKIYEVGSTLFSATEITNYLTCTPAYCVPSAPVPDASPSGSYGGDTSPSPSPSSVGGGSAVATQLFVIGSAYDNKLSYGTYTIGYTVQFPAGTDTVITTKGNPTRRTATNATTLAAEALVNPDITADYHIGPITVTATHSIYAVYAILATTSTITALTAQPLSTATTLTLSMPSETATVKHRFALPSTYTLRKIQILNPLSGQYEDYNMALFTKSSTTHTLPDGTPHPYTLYTRAHGTNGATTFRITFAPA